MERRKFITNCCVGALGAYTTSVLLSSCETLYYAKSKTENNQIIISKTEFIYKKKEKNKIRKFILITPEEFNFPICIYRTENSQYSASLLKCTHNACELNVAGNIYTCPCHGSEFSNKGKLLQGPAEENLRTFKTTNDTKNIYIQLS